MFGNKKEILGFDDRWLMALGIPILSSLLSLIFFSKQLTEDPSFFFGGCMAASFFHTALYWIVFRQVFIYYRKRYPDYQQVKRRIILQSVTILVLYLVIGPIAEYLIEERLLNIAEEHDPSPVPMTTVVLIVCALVVAIYESVFFYHQLIKSQLEKEKLERANIHSQLEGLKSQVNPHFLFNSLNTLSYIIPEDPERAVRFVQQLSRVYRYILDIRDKKLIPLSEELEFLDSYMWLLKERFEENLQFEINIGNEHLSKQVVPLSLQMLIENAIKHNIISTRQPLHISVYVEKGDRLIVKNNLQKKNQQTSSTKFGLENIKNRYTFFSSQRVDVIVSVESFIVSLPLLKINKPVTEKSIG